MSNTRRKHCKFEFKKVQKFRHENNKKMQREHDELVLLHRDGKIIPGTRPEQRYNLAMWREKQGIVKPLRP